VLEKKILVPLGTSETNFKGVHHALALAKRLGARVYVLQQGTAESGDPLGETMGEALLDLINSARQAGLTLSHYVATRDLKEEIIDMVEHEGIDLLVFEVDDDISRQLLIQVTPLINAQIIQVRNKAEHEDEPFAALKGDIDEPSVQHTRYR